MTSPSTHLHDFHLAQRCLEQDELALKQMQERCREPVKAFLLQSGASRQEADELVEQLWADCAAPLGRATPRLASYDGTCSLRTWLRAVALNKLLTRKRRDLRWAQLVPQRIECGQEDNASFIEPNAGTPELRDEHLLSLMREAVEAAFGTCAPEDFVLLQLVHCGDLKLREVAPMLGCSVATASRQLKRAGDEIAASTLAYVRASDPWLELKWEDFAELCRSSQPGCFGFQVDT